MNLTSLSTYLYILPNFLIAEILLKSLQGELLILAQYITLHKLPAAQPYYILAEVGKSAAMFYGTPVNTFQTV